MIESSNRQGMADGGTQVSQPAPSGEAHADLLELFGRWEVLADSDSDPRAGATLTPSYSGAARPR
jgi:hypothetical protein